MLIIADTNYAVRRILQLLLDRRDFCRPTPEMARLLIKELEQSDSHLMVGDWFLPAMKPEEIVGFAMHAHAHGWELAFAHN